MVTKIKMLFLNFKVYLHVKYLVINIIE